MIWLQEGHLTQRPSGTRLSLFGASIGFWTFLNHAIATILTDQSNQLPTSNSQLPTSNSQGDLRGAWVKVHPNWLILHLSPKCFESSGLGVGSWKLGVKFWERSTECPCPSTGAVAPGQS